MSENEFFYVPEINDLTMTGGHKKKKSSYKPSETKETNTSSGEVGASTSGTTGAGTVGTAIPIVMSVTVVALIVVSIVQMTVGAPSVNVTEWNMTYHSISFSFSAEISDTSYTIALEHLDQRLESVDVDHSERVVTFDGLSPSTEYSILIEHDWGEGLQTMIEYLVMTRDSPTFPNGRVTISNVSVNETEQTLEFFFAVNDPNDYLSEFRFFLTDGEIEQNIPLSDPNLPLIVDASAFAPGFLHATLYGRSSHVSFGGEEIVLTRYEIFY